MTVVPNPQREREILMEHHFVYPRVSEVWRPGTLTSRPASLRPSQRALVEASLVCVPPGGKHAPVTAKQ